MEIADVPDVAKIKNRSNLSSSLSESWSSLFLALFSCIFILSACQEKPRVTRIDVTARAYRLIDAQKPTEAIQLLESALQKEPENRTYRMALASAYAHRAGFKIQKLIPVLNKAQSYQNLQQSQLDPAGPSVKPLAFNAAQLVDRSHALSQVFASIPAVSQENSQDLMQAIDTLKELGPELLPEEAIYKVVLQVILFKHYLELSLLGPSPAQNPAQLAECRIEAKTLTESVQLVSDLLLDIYQDLGVAHPSQVPTLQRLTEETEKSRAEILKTASSFNSMDKNSQLFLKISLVKLGFGLVLKCD